uniref:DDE Tnp4 domain-containing protein n=1 Tax=Brassica oleracea var. oleracea TaxID=109376 RepID=A0A0D3BVW3_BRAOL
MASSSRDIFEEMLEEMFESTLYESMEQIVNEEFENLFVNRQQPTRSKKKRVYIERDREDGHNRLWNDYFCENATYPHHLFRRRFRMNKPLFMRIVTRLANEVPFFQQRRDATGRFGLSGLQKATAAIRMMAYGCAADAVDEYLRLGESTAISCLENFVEGIINLFGDEYLRKPTPQDLQRLLDIGEMRGFPGMIGSIDCRAPKVNFFVNGHEYHLAYYLTDGIYPKWSTFIQSISLPQTPKASLFATLQESVRKDVERAFGVLQARFAIVKNPALIWDKVKIGKIMRACIILHNMIVEDERDGYTQFDVSEFAQVESSRSSHVDFMYSTDMPSNTGNLMAIRTRLRDRNIHEQLKNDLVEHIWRKFGTRQNNY